ncbi:MAG: glutamine amidotransferase [Firmicutes bacterium]|nr:glutamine amidotransferase [Bacillota bacterium]
MKINIMHLYPDLLNLYGDRGNIICMKKRLEWRGIEVQTVQVLAGEKPDFTKSDIVLLGGGSDREQELVCTYLRELRRDFRSYAEDGGTVLALCGGYQLLGQYYKTADKFIEGLGILDIYTEWQPKRLVGNIILENPLFKDPIVGFENHGGRTFIGEHTALGKVLSGFGNNDKVYGQNTSSDKSVCAYEGVIYKNIIGTYLHGPLLPKNPEICDYLLSKALIRKYGTSVSFCLHQKSGVLAPLDDCLEHKANKYMTSLLLQNTKHSCQHKSKHSSL